MTLGGFPDVAASMRQRWLPVLAAGRLPEPDCRPARLMLLGEDLAAFRNTEGKLGLIDNLCPHQGSLLAWGVPEEGGLTCPYHGWAFDTAGHCVWIPGAPNTPGYLSQYDVRAYPLVEAGAVLWTFMGAGDAPAGPNPAWPSVPDDHIAATQWQVTAGWDYALEGQAQAVGWPGLPAGEDAVALEGPDGLRLWLGATPATESSVHCTAVLWHPDRPLTEAERNALPTRASGPADALRELAGL